MENVTLLTAFLFGILSFISPCVLPLIPGYISFISGVSLEEIKDAAGRGKIFRRVLLSSLLFVLGFSTVFVFLGATATFVGQFLRHNIATFNYIAGGIIILFGLHLAGIFKLSFLNYEKRIHIKKPSYGLLGSLFIGFAFAFGWTPCIGPILGAILALASQEKTVAQGMILLSFYSVGLGIPFIFTALSITTFLKLFKQAKKYLGAVEILSGVLLIVVGVLLITGQLTLIAAYLVRWFPFLTKLT